MKKILAPLSFFLVLTAIISTSCKKKDEDKKSETYNKVVGSWQSDYEVYDTNNNGIVDSGETMNHIANESYTFNMDGSGFYKEGSSNYPLKWSLLNGDTYLYLNEHSLLGLGATDSMEITGLNASSMSLKIINQQQTHWLVLKK